MRNGQPTRHSLVIQGGVAEWRAKLQMHELDLPNNLQNGPINLDNEYVMHTRHHPHMR